MVHFQCFVTLLSPKWRHNNAGHAMRTIVLPFCQEEHLTHRKRIGFFAGGTIFFPRCPAMLFGWCAWIDLNPFPFFLEGPDMRTPDVRTRTGHPYYRGVSLSVPSRPRFRLATCPGCPVMSRVSCYQIGHTNSPKFPMSCRCWRIREARINAFRTVSGLSDSAI